MSDLIGTIFAVFLIVIFIAIIMALPVMLLWNWLMPDLFGLVEITFMQALGLSLLFGFLFKSSTNNSK